jgi:hypothetical protein
METGAFRVAHPTSSSLGDDALLEIIEVELRAVRGNDIPSTHTYWTGAEVSSIYDHSRLLLPPFRSRFGGSDHLCRVSLLRSPVTIVRERVVASPPSLQTESIIYPERYFRTSCFEQLR